MSKTYDDLKKTFDGEFRRKPDIMEPYVIRLDGVTDEQERVAIMRAGLRETIGARWPLAEVRRIA